MTEEEVPETLVPRSWGWQFHTGWPFTESAFALDTLASGDPAIVGSFGSVNADRLPAYPIGWTCASRADSRSAGACCGCSSTCSTRDRTNLNGYDYRASLTGGRAVATRSGQEVLPRLPTSGASWEF